MEHTIFDGLKDYFRDDLKMENLSIEVKETDACFSSNRSEKKILLGTG